MNDHSIEWLLFGLLSLMVGIVIFIFILSHMHYETCIAHEMQWVNGACIR